MGATAANLRSSGSFTTASATRSAGGQEAAKYAYRKGAAGVMGEIEVVVNVEEPPSTLTSKENVATPPAPAPRSIDIMSVSTIVELVRTPLGLGLSVDAQNKVVAIAHDSQADRSGCFAVYDQLVSLNGQPLTQNSGASFEEQLGVIAVGTEVLVEIQ